MCKRGVVADKGAAKVAQLSWIGVEVMQRTGGTSEASVRTPNQEGMSNNSKDKSQ